MRTCLLLSAILATSTIFLNAQTSAPKPCPVTHAPAPTDAGEALALIQKENAVHPNDSKPSSDQEQD
jgi:hypothetical protein